MEKKFSTLASEINKPLTFAARAGILIFLLTVLLTIVVFPMYDILQKGILYQLKYRTDKFIILLVIEIVTIAGFYALIKISLKNRHLRTELPTKKWTNFLSPYAAILNLLIIS